MSMTPKKVKESNLDPISVKDSSNVIDSATSKKGKLESIQTEKISKIVKSLQRQSDAKLESSDSVKANSSSVANNFDVKIKDVAIMTDDKNNEVIVKIGNKRGRKPLEKIVNSTTQDHDVVDSSNYLNSGNLVS